MSTDEQGKEPELAAAAPSEPASASTSEPDDADDLRGFHFRKLMHKPLTWILWIGGSLIGAGIAAAFGGPIIGVVVLVVLFLVGLWIVWQIADSQAADDFFHVYAKKRGLELAGKSSLGSATPLLRKGDDQYADRTLTGELAPGIDGVLALYTYVVETTDSHGNRQETDHPFTLGMVEVPECVAHVPELYCQGKFGFHALEKFEDVFRRSKERVKLESKALDDKYEIFVGKGQDENWLRRLFEPSFIVWLTESAPDHFAFELVDGTLVAYVHGHKEDSADLDKVSGAACAVAKRLRDESAE
jgi:hypothetical protein